MSKNSIIYITKDRERALGKPEDSTYSIISGDGSIDTLELLSNIKKIEEASILVFKNTKQIEEVAKEKGWVLLNPSAELAERIENKITQVEWLGELKKLLPPHEIIKTKDINKTDCVVQWAHSHTGEGTMHIKNELELKELKSKFGERDARVTEYIKGPMFTANIVVAKNKVLIGNISYQITGISPFTDNPFSTIGNDWSVPFTILTEKLVEEFNNIASEIGNRKKDSGWKGLFGIDVIYDEERDELFLIEINARQPASTTYESQLQMKAREKGVVGMTTFEAHLSALTGEDVDSLVVINDGAQIIQRVTANLKKVDTEALKKLGYNVIEYNNIKINNDLIRIQSERGIMEAHNKFNRRGKEIEEIVKLNI
jgi:predicted ATP-grasp superfamily ATP-dependent carboligase